MGFSLQTVQESVAQTVGVTATIGSYSASYFNPKNVEETVQGKSSISIGGTYEIPLDIVENLVVPINLTFSKFNSEQRLADYSLMTQKANAVNLASGAKYFFYDENSTVRPFVGAMLNYELYVNSTYYYNTQQSGNLDWKSNLSTIVQTGVGISSDYDSRIDVFAFLNLGMLNRLDKATYGTYKDRVLGVGVNYLFN